jgi:hypothetical protein
LVLGPQERFAMPGLPVHVHSAAGLYLGEARFTHIPLAGTSWGGAVLHGFTFDPSALSPADDVLIEGAGQVPRVRARFVALLGLQDGLEEPRAYFIVSNQEEPGS